jgi:hypothetical protein
MVSGSRVPASRLAALSPRRYNLQVAASGSALPSGRMTRSLIEPHCSAAS